MVPLAEFVADDEEDGLGEFVVGAVKPDLARRILSDNAAVLLFTRLVQILK
jgi:hypothetical protein